MGCDIHLHVECKGSSRNVWRKIDRQISIRDWRAQTVLDLGWGDHRNYNAFAMLANVRNGSGFAGVDTGDGFEPISLPRGIPHDCSSELIEEAESWGVDGHSHSYLTLRELLDLEKNGYWDKTTVHRGVFTTPELNKAKEDGIVLSQEGQSVVLSGPPTSYAGGISGPDPSEIFNLSFMQTYRRSAGWLYESTIPALKELASSWAMREFFQQGINQARPGERLFPTLVDDDDRVMGHWIDTGPLVRIVFWFDN